MPKMEAGIHEFIILLIKTELLLQYTLVGNGKYSIHKSQEIKKKKEIVIILTSWPKKH